LLGEGEEVLLDGGESPLLGEGEEARSMASHHCSVKVRKHCSMAATTVLRCVRKYRSMAASHYYSVKVRK